MKKFFIAATILVVCQLTVLAQSWTADNGNGT